MYKNPEQFSACEDIGWVLEGSGTCLPSLSFHPCPINPIRKHFSKCLTEQQLQSRSCQIKEREVRRLPVRLWESHASPFCNQFLLLLKEELRTWWALKIHRELACIFHSPLNNQNKGFANTPYKYAEFSLSRRWSVEFPVGLFWVGSLVLLSRWTQTAVSSWWVICRTRYSFRCVCTGLRSWEWAPDSEFVYFHGRWMSQSLLWNKKCINCYVLLLTVFSLLLMVSSLSDSPLIHPRGREFVGLNTDQVVLPGVGALKIDDLTAPSKQSHEIRLIVLI